MQVLRVVDFPVSRGPANDAVEEFTNTLDAWLSHPLQLEAAKSELESLKETTLQTGANARAADAILEVLQPATQSRAA